MSFDLPALPEGWSYAALDSCCHKGSITYGIVQPGSPVNEGVPIVRVNNFRETRLDLHDVMRVAPDVEAKYGRTRLKGGEVLLTIVGSVGQVAVAPASIAGFNVARAVAVIEPLAHVSADWIALCLRSPLSQHLLGSRANTTVQTTINLKDLRALPIPLPPANERRKIETLIGALDDRITLLRETNATLEAIAQALFKSWFVDFDPVRAKMVGRAPEGIDEATAALFPDAFEETELRGVPKGWSLAPLSTVVKLAEGKPWAATNRVDASDISVFGANGRIGFASEPLGEGRVIFLGKIGSCGAINAYKGLWWATNNAFYIDKSANQALEWCRQVLGSIDFKGYVGGSSNPYMPLKNFAHHPVICAPMEIQLFYEDFAGTLRTKIESNSDQAEHLATLRDTLLPRLISGQLRLDIEAETGFKQYG